MEERDPEHCPDRYPEIFTETTPHCTAAPQRGLHQVRTNKVTEIEEESDDILGMSPECFWGGF